MPPHRAPIVISLRSSRQLVIVLTAAHAVAAGAVLATPLPWPAVTALLMLVATSLMAFLQRRGERLPARLELGRAGSIEVFDKVSAGGTVATLLPESTILAGMVLLALRLDARRRYLLLMPDSVAPDALRHLRVWLRWQG